MNLFIRKKAYIFMDRYNVLDDSGRSVYSIDGKLVRYFGKLEMRDRAGIKVLDISKGANPFFASYSIADNGEEKASVRQKFKVRPHFDFTYGGKTFEITGSIRACDFAVMDGENIAARIRKRSLRWGDTYVLSIQDLDLAPVFCSMTVCLDNALFHNLL